MYRPAFFLSFCTFVLFSCGLLMIFNTSAAQIIDKSLPVSPHFALVKQLIYGVVGAIIGLIFYRLGYQFLLRHSFLLLILGTLLLCAVFIPGVGQTVNGARRWIAIGSYSFQPSEWVKLILPLAYIHWVSRHQGPISWSSFIKMLGILAIPIFLILLEPDNGTTVIIFAVLLMLFLLSDVNIKYWFLPLVVLVGLGVTAASQMPHVQDRIRIYLHPELDLKGKGHQPYQAKIAAGSGKLWGRGLGESLQKLNYLPEARNDYIAAIFAEETGFIGILVMIGLYMGICYSGFMIAIRSVQREAFLVASMITFLISIQAFLNLGIVSGLLPSKGMTLPFFSQGGTSLIVNIAALFILLDISRMGKKQAKVS
jgi:cell division protein FtsW